MKRGALRTADPEIAAMHLLSLLESELLQRVLPGVIDTMKPEALGGIVRRAVDVFLSGYERRELSGRLPVAQRNHFVSSQRLPSSCNPYSSYGSN